MLEIYEFVSVNNGKHILITGAVHGNEVCGAIASKNIINKIKSGDIKLNNGRITFIPICNPEANRINKRFFEVNLNRVIKKHDNPKLYEEKIANILTDYIKNSDYHLDLHSMHVNGNPFAFQDYPEQAEFAKVLGLEYIFVGWPNVYENSETIKDYSTQNYAHNNNVISTTVECGSHTDPNAIKVAEECILKALSYLGIIEYKFKNTNNQHFIDMKKVYFKEKEGKLAKEYIELEKISKGEVVAIYDDGEKIIANDNYLIIFPNNSAQIGDEWFYFGKQK